jgi:hypothetical protein
LVVFEGTAKHYGQDTQISVEEARTKNTTKQDKSGIFTKFKQLIDGRFNLLTPPLGFQARTASKVQKY